MSVCADVPASAAACFDSHLPTVYLSQETVFDAAVLILSQGCPQVDLVRSSGACCSLDFVKSSASPLYSKVYHATSHHTAPCCSAPHCTVLCPLTCDVTLRQWLQLACGTAPPHFWLSVGPSHPHGLLAYAVWSYMHHAPQQFSCCLAAYGGTWLVQRP